MHIGINAGCVSYYTTGQPWLNKLKSTQPFSGRKAGVDPNAVERDENLYAKSMKPHLSEVPFDQLDTNVLMSLPPPYYTGGQYIMTYDGEGTISYLNDARKNVALSKPGRDVLDVTPSGAGIKIAITSINEANYPRNMCLIEAGHEALLHDGQSVDPRYAAIMNKFDTIRYMDMCGANNATRQTSWNNRAMVTDAFWGQHSTPLGAMLKISNQTKTNMWWCVPPAADDKFVRNAARFIKDKLKYGQKVYLELSNELWNWGMASQRVYAAAKGRDKWGIVPGLSDNSYVLNWQVLRTNEVVAIWKDVWGVDFERVIPVLGSQSANVAVTRYLLDLAYYPNERLTGGAGSPSADIKAIAVAPYFGFGLKATDAATWLTDADGGLNKLFAYLAPEVDQQLKYLRDQKTICDKFDKQVVAYEWGPHLVDYSGDLPAVQKLYEAANRDPRMGELITRLAQGWEAVFPGQVACFYAAVGAYGKFGYWGALESQYGDPHSAKYDALVSLSEKH